jgi:hemerythrin-like domain-containing protein
MKRSDALQPLSHDHYQGLVVVRRLQQGLDRDAPPDVMADYAQHVWTAHLARHFEQEEAHLLVPLREAGDDGRALATQMLDEHHQIRAHVEALGDSATSEVVRTLADALRAHIRFEERTLFPFLEATCDPVALQAIGTELEDAHEDTDLDYTPAFWER